MNEYTKSKKHSILNYDNVISILGLIDNGKLIGFISLFKNDCEIKKELSPWNTTIYVKKE